EHSVSLSSALEELAALFHRVAIAQTVPDATAAFSDAPRVKSLAHACAPEFVQLSYQICVQGRSDLALAPDEPTGFAMTLLRLLAFAPAPYPGSKRDREATAAPSSKRPDETTVAKALPQAPDAMQSGDVASASQPASGSSP